MKKFAQTAFAATAALALAGSLASCGKSDDAADQATPDNVEMPADDLPAAQPSLAAPPPEAPAADASQAASSAEDAARSAADSAVSAAEAAKAAAAEAQQQQQAPPAAPQQ